MSGPSSDPIGQLSESDPDDLFFNEIENHIKIVVPKFTKNILKISGLSNRVAFQSFTETNLIELENFVKNDLKDLVDQTQYEDYFEVYKNNPEKFKFLVGYKKVIEAIKCQTNVKKGTKSKEVAGSNLSDLSEIIQTKTEISKDLPTHNRTVQKLLIDWLKTAIKNIENEDEQQLILNTMREADYQCFLDGKNIISCNIRCCICSKSIKMIQKLKTFAPKLLTRRRDALNLRIKYSEESISVSDIKLPVILLDENEDEAFACNEVDSDDIMLNKLENLEVFLEKDTADDITVTESKVSDLDIELADFSEELCMKDYNMEKLDESNPFVHIKVANKIITVRKTSLCWLSNDQDTIQ
ncbi:hypothetical protein FQR65_LT03459 [Abscondita terminalis]|nr:hypothetical protein FQR65_LT03459 [Abscondita terminalis]